MHVLSIQNDLSVCMLCVFVNCCNSEKNQRIGGRQTKRKREDQLSSSAKSKFLLLLFKVFRQK